MSGLPATLAAPCDVHEYHSPRPQLVDVHHVVPISWGGPDVAANRVALCPTGHRNVHWLLDQYVRAHGPPPWDVRGSIGPDERALAARAWATYLADPARYHPVRTL